MKERMKKMVMVSYWRSVKVAIASKFFLLVSVALITG